METILLKEKTSIENSLEEKCTSSQCHSCDKELDFTIVEAYEHEGGWNVSGFKSKMWLSIYCPHCEYETSINKLGVSKDSKLKFNS